MAVFLVTVGAGFVSANYHEETCRHKAEVRVLDDFSTSKRGNILSFMDHIEFMEGDIRSYHIARKAVAQGSTLSFIKQLCNQSSFYCRSYHVQ